MEVNTKKLADLNRRLLQLYGKIILKSQTYSSSAERINYLEKIICDCEKIISGIELSGPYNYDHVFDNKPENCIDDNFLMLLDENVPESTKSELTDVDGEIPLCLMMELVNKNDNTLIYKIDKLSEMKITLRLDKERMLKQFQSTKLGNKMGQGKFKITSSLSDIVRIFETMKESGIISRNTTIKQIAGLFYDDKDDIASWERNYNSAKNKIKTTRSHARSNHLKNFVKLIAETSYKENDLDLDDLIRYLEEIQNNAI